MSRLIKFADVAGREGGVRDLNIEARAAASQTARPPVVNPELTALEDALRASRAQLETYEARCREHEHDLRAASREGEDKGRREGLASADARETERLALLGAAIDKAVERFADDLGAMERLAAALAREGLSKVFGPSDQRADDVVATIRHHVVALEDQAILSVRVSHEDFDDEAKLKALAAAVGTPRVDIQGVEALPSGDCRIKLSLGEMEIGIGQQWARLSSALDAMAREASAP